MSVIRRLYNVARGKVISARDPGVDPALADEPLRPRPRPAEPESATDEETEEDQPAVGPSTGPRPRRL